MELDGGVSRVTGLLDTLAAADRMQAAAAKVRADAMLASASNGDDLPLTLARPNACAPSWFRWRG